MVCRNKSTFRRLYGPQSENTAGASVAQGRFRRIGCSIGVSAALLISVTSSRAAQPPQYGWRLDGSAFLKLGQGFETPHTPWCIPSAAGVIKALFLVSQDAAWDVPELGRRLSLSIRGMPAQTWLRLGENYWLALWLESSASTERAAHFEAMLDDEYDVIVLGNYRFASLYESIQYKILQKVANGGGLVMFYTHDVDPRLRQRAIPEAVDTLAIGVPFAGLDFYRNIFMPRHDLVLPEQIGRHLFHAWQFGRGRVLEVAYGPQSSVFAAVPGSITPFEDYDYGAPVQYDYHQSLAARCLQWAAGRSGRLAWTGPLPDGMEIEAMTEGPPVAVECRWTGAEAVRLMRRLRIRNRWGDVVTDAEQAIGIRPGENTVRVAIPPLPGGLHFVDVIVSGTNGVEDWGSFAVDVRSPVRIDAIELASTFVERDQDVAGRVVLSGTPPAGQRVALRLRLEDGYGRLFSEKAVPIDAGSDRVPFNLPQGNLVSWGARLRVTLLIDDRPAHQAETELRFRRPSRGEYPIAMWGSIHGYGNHIGNLQMRNLGFTTLLEGSPMQGARDDMGWMTFGGGVGAQIHSLGDEISVPHPTKGRVFAEFLRKRYASIDELNAAWGTKYEAWTDAEPVATAQDGSAASFVRLHDSLSCGEFMYADNCRKRREEINRTNPPGVVGPEGSPVGDPDLTLPEVTFWGPYLTVRDNLLVNAVARPGILRGNWFGGYVEDRQVPTRLRHVLWLSILGGNNMIEYFTVGGGLLAPDLTLMPFTAEFLDSWHQLRRGLGPLLARCRPAGNSVALLHSQPSQHVGQAGGQATDTVKVHEYMLELLGDAGYSPQYVTANQVRDGRLQKGDVKVLFLLHAFALADAEIAEIIAFAGKGGTVIADILPAWFDERCRLRDVRAMDALFGIEPARPKASLKERVALMTEQTELNVTGHKLLVRGRDPAIRAHADGDLSSETAGNAPSEASVTGSETKASGGRLPSPLVRGRFILLNGVLWKEGREDAESARALRALIADLAGTPPVFEAAFKPPAGKPGAKVYSYHRGDIRIDAVLPPEATDPAVDVVPIITWGRSKHTYDLREEKYVGYLDHLEKRVERSSPLVVARLDYQVGRVKIEAPKTIAMGGVASVKCAVLDVDGKPRPGHVIRVKVENPDGRDCPYYGAMLDADGPEQSMRIPFALNDPPGDWRITATDVISGASSTTAIRLTK